MELRGAFRLPPRKQRAGVSRARLGSSTKSSGSKEPEVKGCKDDTKSKDINPTEDNPDIKNQLQSESDNIADIKESSVCALVRRNPSLPAYTLFALEALEALGEDISTLVPTPKHRPEGAC